MMTSEKSLRGLCSSVMVLAALSMLLMGVMRAANFPKSEYDLWVFVSALLFSAALVGRCILEASRRARVDT